jgi:ATP-dependent Clp protease ATP-binding subunit ClpC
VVDPPPGDAAGMCLPPRRTDGHHRADRHRRAVALARDEAAALAAPALGTEHLLLGLVREERGSRRGVLAGVDPDALRALLPRPRWAGRRAGPSRRAVAALASARRLAHRRGEDDAGVEHLLAAVLGDPDCAAVVALERLGIDVGDLWSRAVAELDHDRVPRRLALR